MREVSMQGSEFVYESFTRVSPRKKRKGKGRGSTTLSDLFARVREELVSDGRWAAASQELLQKAFHDARIKPRKVLCLGLGSPCSSRDARAQLAFLVHLCTFSGIDTANVFLYDPVFTDADGELLKTLGMQCLDPIQGTEYLLERATILYMPHCDMNLYERVIRANWTFQGLCNIIFVANRLSDYVDNNAASKLEKEYPCILKLVPLLESQPLPTSDAFPNAFNNLCIQYVTRTPSPQHDGFPQMLPFLERHVV